MAYRLCPLESRNQSHGGQLLPISIIKMSTSKPLGTNQEGSSISSRMNGRILGRGGRSLKSAGRMTWRRCSITRIVASFFRQFIWTSIGNTASPCLISTVTTIPLPSSLLTTDLITPQPAA